MRKNRQKSSMGLYHIVIRGENRQNIFCTDKDKVFFLHLLKKDSAKYNVRLHAYALMSNHVHLILEDLDEKFSKFMQVVTSIYARYFNRVYDRTGHLFQDRFASEVIEDENYYLEACRYVIQNPMKANLCNGINYLWNSFKEYKYSSNFVYKDLLFSLLKSYSKLKKFLSAKNDSHFFEPELRPSEKEKSKLNLVLKLLKTKNPIIQPDLSKEELVSKIEKLRRAGLSINTITRITGLNRYLVQSVKVS